MKKAVVLPVSILCCLISRFAYVSEPAQRKTENSDDTICRLDKSKISHNMKLSDKSSFGYTLSDDVSCYVVDKSEFSYLQRRNVTDYLTHGGSIIINDKNITMKDIVDKVDLDCGDLSFLDSENTYGTFLYNSENGIEIDSYSLGLIEKQETLDEMAKDQIEKQAYQTEQSIAHEDIIDWIIQLIKKITSEFNENSDNESTRENESDEIILGTATCYNLLYGLISGKRMCSYKINTEVRQGQKYLDESNIKRGIYDITSEYIVGAESGYRIKDYQPMIFTEDELLDATYIQSDKIDQYTFSSSIGFSGTKIGANVKTDVGYSICSTGQDISNSFDFAEQQAYWNAKPMKSNNYGESYKLTPGIRIISRNDEETIRANLTMNKFIIKGRLFY